MRKRGGARHEARRAPPLAYRLGNGQAAAAAAARVSPTPTVPGSGLASCRGIRRRRRDLTADAGRWSLSAAGERGRAVATPMRCRQQTSVVAPVDRRSVQSSVGHENWFKIIIIKETEKQIPSRALRHTACAIVRASRTAAAQLLGTLLGFQMRVQ